MRVFRRSHDRELYEIYGKSIVTMVQGLTENDGLGTRMAENRVSENMLFAPVPRWVDEMVKDISDLVKTHVTDCTA